jgi:hypothetical protein
MKTTKDNFRIEGWFPPCIANTLSGRYACCGGNWIPIEDNVTIEDVMKGWTCTAPAWKPKEENTKTKRPTKSQLTKKQTPQVVLPKVNLQKIVIKIK